ncbi:hypothetical protein K488DRAFT_42740 [Vararia minispora EC-137]|uniref:Uncharacterized protein n=1 Tax=Vararia minispora EC-137 TaxID=1314806 RepID=A0ACB8QVR2_9AGAM|nr:hypothetical protein K488DRAFT_42740 [Vararia minispora EC-137]
MNSRLASFRGPSTPNSSPVQQRYNQKSPRAPTSPARQTESTFHRKVRSSLQELRTACRTWDDLISHDGLKAVQKLVDARTDLDNQLAQVPGGGLPRTRIVGPKLAYMDERIHEIDAIVAKLRKQFAKMAAVVEGLDTLIAEAHKAKGWEWVHGEPLWVTWTLEKFVTSIGEILRPYHRSLEQHAELAAILRPHSVTFEESRDAVHRWIEEPFLEDERWDARWEDLCLVEIDKWDSR